MDYLKEEELRRMIRELREDLAKYTRVCQITGRECKQKCTSRGCYKVDGQWALLK